MNENEHDRYWQGALLLTPPESDSHAGVMTPRDAAKARIRAYVLRGDSPEELMRGLMGTSGTDFHAQIGGGIDADGGRTKVRRDQIGVSRVGAEPVSAVFPLAALYREIQAEAETHADAAGEDDAATIVDSVGDLPIARIDRDPDVLPNRRMSGDFWPEFHTSSRLGGS